MIVGGSGFIGRCLAAKCLETVPSISCLGMPVDACGIPGVEYLRGDVRSITGLRRLLKGRRFDYVFNLSGYIDHARYFNGGRPVIDAHFTGLINIIDCLDRSVLKGFVQIGSSDEYGQASAPQKESMRCSPATPYAFAKLASTELVRMLWASEGFPGTVLRPFLVYGPGQDGKRLIPQVIRACLRNERFKTSRGVQLRDLCYVEDVAEAMIRAAVSKRAKGRVINVGSGRPVRIGDVVRKIVRLAGGGRPAWGAHPYKEGENMRLYPDISLARSLLGWLPATPLEEGLRMTIEHYAGSNASRRCR